MAEQNGSVFCPSSGQNNENGVVSVGYNAQGKRVVRRLVRRLVPRLPKENGASGTPAGQKGVGASGTPAGQKGVGASGSAAGQTAADAILQAKRAADAILQAQRKGDANLQAKRAAKRERQRERRAAAQANGGGVFGSSATQPVSTPIHLTSLTKPSPAASHTQMTPTSIPVEIDHKKLKKEAILNSPLPMILISRILKGIPQSPHFLQLRCYSATARRNLEAAWDRTFEEAVEQIHELRASDFWAMARKLWKTMEELQSLGYDVFVPRKRVVELTDVMVKQNKRQNEIMVLKTRAELHRMENSRLESAIRNLKAQARNAQDKMVKSLIEAADKEKDLPEIENQIVDLESQPLKKRKLA